MQQTVAYMLTQTLILMLCRAITVSLELMKAIIGLVVVSLQIGESTRKSIGGSYCSLFTGRRHGLTNGKPAISHRDIAI